MLGLTPNLVVNRAILLYGNNQPPVTGTLPNFDTSPAGVAASKLYTGVVQTVGRQFGWDFARNQATLTLTGNTPPIGWVYEYAYPTSGLEVRQLMPPALADENDPRPISWTVGNAMVAAVSTKVIWANEPNATAFISGQPPEALWDSIFTEAVVRLLSSELAQAIAGKPETSQNLLGSAQAFEQINEGRAG